MVFMILSDIDIKKKIKQGMLVVEPISDIGPGTIDLTLGTDFKIFKHIERPMIDLKDKSEYVEELKEEKFFIIHPGEFVLGITKEMIKLPTDLIGFLKSRASLTRLGILVYSTMGVVHPGFSGKLTLEIANYGRFPVKLFPEMKICQIVFAQMSSACEKTYDGKYSDSEKPEASKIFKEF